MREGSEEREGNEPSSTMKKAECLWVRAMRDLKKAGEACLSPPANGIQRRRGSALESRDEKRRAGKRKRTLAENRLDDHSCDGRLDLPAVSHKTPEMTRDESGDVSDREKKENEGSKEVLKSDASN